MKRTFIAVKILLDHQTENFIHDIQKVLADEKIKWVDIENFHITLFFLGDTDEAGIEYVNEQLLKCLKGIGVFKIVCKGLGVFKTVNDPRVLWIGIEKSEQLSLLKRKIDKVMEDCGFRYAKQVFKPHLTLGRVKYLRHKDKLELLLKEYHDKEFQDIPVKEILFYESKLTPKGPIYSVLKKISLNPNLSLGF